MTVGELIEALDDYGDHLQVHIEDAKELRYPVTEVKGGKDEDGLTIAVLSYE